MKLGISQLAFNTDEDFESFISILKENSILNIEIVFPKIISWKNVDLIYLKKYINKLHKLGFNTLSTQSITYNTPLKSFCDESFIEHISQISDLCKITNTKIMVLGAPKLRDIYNESILINNFSKIDFYLKKNNQILCIEPNNSWHGGKFFLYLDEIVSFIKKGNFTNIKTMIDTHNIIKENKNPADEFIKYQEYISHVHVSEDNLDSFKVSNLHIELKNCLEKENYENLIVYETKICENIKEFKNTYSKN